MRKDHDPNCADLDDRVVVGQRVEVIVKDGFADNVKRQTAEKVLHLDGPSRSCCRFQRLPSVKPT